jgi:hypothetical protein
MRLVASTAFVAHRSLHPQIYLCLLVRVCRENLPVVFVCEYQTHDLSRLVHYEFVGIATLISSIHVLFYSALCLL